MPGCVIQPKGIWMAPKQVALANLQAVYDMSANPASYDFLLFLAVAEMYRITHGLGGIDVHFMPGEEKRFYEQYFPKDEGEREGLLWRVCVPACRLVKSVKGVTVYQNRKSVSGRTYPPAWEPSHHVLTHGAAMFKQAALCFEATEQARKWVERRYRNYLTITLRECEYGTNRNSDLDVWRKVAMHLIQSGQQVVIVPDTLGHEFPGFLNCVPASWDIDIRMALYEQAILNLGDENGPMSLCLLSQAKCLMRDLNIDMPNTETHFFIKHTPADELIAAIEGRLKA